MEKMEKRRKEKNNPNESIDEKVVRSGKVSFLNQGFFCVIQMSLVFLKGNYKKLY